MAVTGSSKNFNLATDAGVPSGIKNLSRFPPSQAGARSRPDQVEHADKLIERILMLDGLPNLQDLNKLLLGETTEEMLGCYLKLELASQISCKGAIKHFESGGDYVSREIVVEILEDTEAHIDWLQTQLGLVAKVGLQNYLQSAMGAPS